MEFDIPMVHSSSAVIPALCPWSPRRGAEHGSNSSSNGLRPHDRPWYYIFRSSDHFQNQCVERWWRWQNERKAARDLVKMQFHCHFSFRLFSLLLTNEQWLLASGSLPWPPRILWIRMQREWDTGFRMACYACDQWLERKVVKWKLIFSE